MTLAGIGCKRIFRLRSPEYKNSRSFKYKQILGFPASTQLWVGDRLFTANTGKMI
ncbi:hypothetical protein [Nostoc sp.]|uniref:hypothetical protein n=1 Tax=Nostoc sp. TaxID=1180 RepID=UPI002FFC2CC3